MPNRFGACSCCGAVDCTPIDEVDLPDVTISGYSAVGGWTETGSRCCWTRAFDNDTTTYTEWCTTLPIVDTTLDYEIEDKLWALKALTLKATLGAASCPIPAEMCCWDDPPCEVVYTRTTTFAGDIQIHMRVRYRTSRIYVQYGRRNFDCGSGPVEKYYLGTSAEVNGNYGIFPVGSVSVTCAEVTHACFSLDTPVLDDYLQEWQDLCDPVEHPWATTAFCDGGSFGQTFCRIKLYDTPPTGSITFSNSDNLSGCTADGLLCQCNEGFDVTEVCVSPDSSIYTICFPEPTVTGCNPTETFIGNDCTGGMSIYSCFEGCDISTPFCNVARNCDDVTQTFHFDFIWSDSFAGLDETETLALYCYGVVGGGWLFPFDCSTLNANWLPVLSSAPTCPTDPCEWANVESGNGFQFREVTPLYECNTFATCDATCCQDVYCDEFCGVCGHKWDWLPLYWERNVTGTPTQTCTTNATELCIPATNPTIVLS
jgi:hypothetical protein